MKLAQVFGNTVFKSIQFFFTASLHFYCVNIFLLIKLQICFYSVNRS